MYGFWHNDFILSTLMCHEHNDVSKLFMHAQYWLPCACHMSCLSGSIIACSVHTLVLLCSQVPSIPSRSSLAADVGTQSPAPTSDIAAAPKAGSLGILWGIQICLPGNNWDFPSNQPLIVLVPKQQLSITTAPFCDHGLLAQHELAFAVTN